MSYYTDPFAELHNYFGSTQDPFDNHNRETQRQRMFGNWIEMLKCSQCGAYYAETGKCGCGVKPNDQEGTDSF
jgi:hypothetical protein